MKKSILFVALVFTSTAFADFSAESTVKGQIFTFPVNSKTCKIDKTGAVCEASPGFRVSVDFSHYKCSVEGANQVCKPIESK